MTQDQLASLAKVVQWVLGAGAVVIVFLLTQSDVTWDPIAKVAMGAYIVFAAYANPSVVAGGAAKAVGKGPAK